MTNGEWGVCAVDVDIFDGVRISKNKELQSVRIAVHNHGSRWGGKSDAVDGDLDI